MSVQKAPSLPLSPFWITSVQAVFLQRTTDIFQSRKEACENLRIFKNNLFWLISTDNVYQQTASSLVAGFFIDFFWGVGTRGLHNKMCPCLSLWSCLQ